MHSRLKSAGYLNATFWYEKKAFRRSNQTAIQLEGPLLLYLWNNNELFSTYSSASLDSYHQQSFLGSARPSAGTQTPQRFASTHSTYWQDHAVLETGKFTVTLLTPVQAILLINHFLIAVLSRAGLIHTVLFAKKHHCGHRAEIVRLQEKRATGDTEHQACVRTGLMDWEAAPSVPLHRTGECWCILTTVSHSRVLEITRANHKTHEGNKPSSKAYYSLRVNSKFD